MVLVALRSPDRALPVVPIAGFVDLPLAADAILAASPRVGPPGTTVTIDGACAGTARLVLEARATYVFTAPGCWRFSHLPSSASAGRRR